MRIDPHVHCRDGKQSYKETIAHAFTVADVQGVQKIFDMPNTDPPITTEKDIVERLKLVPKEKLNDYYVWIGASSDPNQIKEAATCVKKYRNVIGLKLYAGTSVGDLSVVEKEDQKKVYKTLASLDYKGAIAVHCDKESLMKPELWDPQNPISHCRARPLEAEVVSTKEQIELVRETGYSGKIHICHITSAEVVALVEDARKNISITCGVTPHHVLWDDSMMQRPDGLLYKMNPPLRDKATVKGLRQCIIEGKVDWIETDYAPHPVGEKMFEPYMSGYPSLYVYQDFVENFLPSIGVSGDLIQKMTYGNIWKVFEEKIK
jgi:dihydroorotase